MIRFSSCALKTFGMVGAIAVLLWGCGASHSSSDDVLDVLTTSTILRDWADELAPDDINVTSILQPGEDPHVYEPVPRDTIAIESADLIFYNGFNLEPGLIKLIRSSSSAEKKMAVGEVVAPLDFEKNGSIEPDPHVWGSVQNAIAMVQAMSNRLSELSPEDQALIESNAERYIRELKALDTWVQGQIQTIPVEKRQLVTTHDAFQYYSKTYGLNILGTLIGISTEEQPSAQTVKAGVELSEQQLYSDSLGTPRSNADSYIKMMVANTTTIVEGLGGEITPFDIPAPQ